MVLKKQTIWLLTMLTLMVVLSAYYLFYGDVQEIDVSQPADQSSAGDTDHPDATGTATDENQLNITMDDITRDTTEDLFSELRLNREMTRSAQMEHYYNLMVSSEDEEVVAEATAKFDELQTLENNEPMVEELIKAKGFADAVVITNEAGVEVIVQAPELKKEQVVTIINLVSKQLNVPGTKITVDNQP
jgi:stage III sporulation protein AH